MANIKQKIIRIKTNEKSRQRNSQYKSRIRTFYKKAYNAISSNDKDVLEKINAANKELDKGVSKGIVKKGYASRRKSKLMNYYNKSLKNNDSKTSEK